MTDMNKTFIAIAFLVLIALTILGDIVLAILAPDQIPVFNGGAVTILGVGTAALVTIYGLGQQGKKLEQQDEKLEQIQSQTNGTLSKALAEKDAAQAEAAHLREQLAAATGSTPTT